ncbi:hypothetical protein [Methyloversatilis discipulorum]|uniref:hypothetical protein n=1 Tax=Methyloversatilis discipulorum TaxID=1119528 RepID=UPI0012F80CE9|nr:hypothetical protein [Methyloversatilis discipulorum]
MAVFADSAQPLTTAVHFISRLGDETNATLDTASARPLRRGDLIAKPATSGRDHHPSGVESPDAYGVMRFRYSFAQEMAQAPWLQERSREVEAFCRRLAHENRQSRSAKPA